MPWSLFHVNKVSDPSVVKGVLVSTVLPLNSAEITFLANPSLMSLATSIGVAFEANSLTLPSGNVILIIFLVNKAAKIQHPFEIMNRAQAYLILLQSGRSILKNDPLY